MKAIQKRLMQPLRTSAIVGVILAMIAALGISMGSAPQASAATAKVTYASRAYGYTFPATPHYRYGGWSGTYKVANPHNTAQVDRGFCLDPMAYMARATSFITTTGSLPGVSTANLPRVRGTQNEYGMTTSKETARDGFWVIRLLQNYSYYLTDINYLKSHGHLSTTSYNAIMSMYKYSANYSSVKVVVSAPATTYGETGTGKVTFTSTKTHAALKAGYPVTVKVSSNATVTSVNGVAGAKTGKTKSNGTVSYTFRQTNVGTVTHSASIRVPSSTRAILTTRPSSAYQRLVVGSYTETYSGSKSEYKVPGGGSVKSQCSTNCDGTSTVTFTLCNKSTKSPGAFPVANAAGVTRFYVYVPANTCTAKAVQAKDNDVFQVTKMCFTSTLGGKCVSSWTSIPAVKFTVVCPAWIQTAITIGCGCGNAWGDVSVKNPVTPRFNMAYVQVNDPRKGVTTTSYSLASGQVLTVPLSGTVSPGTVVTILWSSYFDAAHTRVIPGFSQKMMESVQLTFGASTSKVPTLHSVKALAQARTAFVKAA